MLGILVAAALALYFLYWEFVGKRKNLPPGPTPLPIIGNALQINRLAPHTTILEWSKKFGPVITVWIGPQPWVMLCTFDAIKEYMFGHNGDIMTGRPRNFLFESMFGGRSEEHLFAHFRRGIVLADGQLWRDQRRFALHVLRDFGFGKSFMEDVVNLSVDELLLKLQGYLTEVSTNEKSGQVTSQNLDAALQLCSTNVIARLIIGHELKEQDKGYLCLKGLLELFEDFNSNPTLLLLQSTPWLRYIPGFTRLGFDRLMETMDRFRSAVAEEMEDHKRRFKPDQEPEDFTMAFLQERHRREKAGEDIEQFSEDQLRALMLDFWLAGTNTSVFTLRFGFFYMIHHPEIQVKIQEELDALYGKSDRAVQMSDRANLPYTAATINEIQRCANIVPINVPHSPTETINIGGYIIEKGTTVIPQSPSVHVDPDVYPDPQQFRPERFLNGKVLSKSEELMPFSMGKRACAGEGLARMELFMIFASIFRRFSMVPPASGFPPLHDKNGIIMSGTPSEYSMVLKARSGQ